MKVSFDKSFHKSIICIKDKQVLGKVKQVILQAEAATDFQQIPNIKKWKVLKPFTAYVLAITVSE